MAIDQLSCILCYHQLVQSSIVTIDNAREIHEFSQSKDVVPQDRIFHIHCVDNSTGILKRSRRHA